MSGYTEDRPRGQLFVVSAPSGAGKTSLVAELIQRMPNLSVCVSHTTRPRRSKETDGVNYHFVDVDTFEKMIADEAFLEHARVFDNYYGTALQTVQETLSEGCDLILEIDWQGAAQVRKLLPEAIGIFILPPSRAELERRLTGRGQDAPDVIRKRLSQAVEEMSHCSEFDYLVVNDVFEDAVADLVSIVRAGMLHRTRQQFELAGLLDDLLDSRQTCG